MVKSGVLCITTHESVDKGKVLPSVSPCSVCEFVDIFLFLFIFINENACNSLLNLFDCSSAMEQALVCAKFYRDPGLFFLRRTEGTKLIFK